MRYRRDFRLRAQTDAERVRELEDEMEAHIAMRAEELERAGMPPARAQAEARARFGNATDVIGLPTESMPCSSTSRSGSG